MANRVHLKAAKLGTRKMIETHTLPAEVPQTLTFTPAAAKSSIATTILLVEDEAFVRQVTADILEFYGYRVLTARNAQEATAKFQRNCNPFPCRILHRTSSHTPYATIIGVLKEGLSIRVYFSPR